ncbi:MAG: DUF4956 domain-containing protein [Clostridiales bacterium]|nr:DUF4956 domain-containing protein [Clostridiales bacterium]
MLETIFGGVFSDSSTETIAVSDFLLCVAASLIIGIFLAISYTYKTRYTKSFVLTLATLPAIVCAVIMMVNGNIGAGVAVAGAFSLVRFRSVPGTAKEIGAIFLAMASGLLTGMGYLGYAVLFALIMGLITLLYQMLGLGKSAKKAKEKTLRITVPEDLNYTEAFDDLFDKYTSDCENVAAKTTNMGSLYKLVYNITLKDTSQEKKFIDELRCRNGNLEINLSQQEDHIYEL